MAKRIFDIAIYESGTGGDLSLKNGDLETVAGLTNMVYLALFGGNLLESTSDELNNLDTRNDWLGNILTEDDALQFNSTFEKKLNEVALTSNGISILERAAESDLEFLKEYADIEIIGSIPAIARFELSVILTEPSNISTKIKFLWDGTKNELIELVII
jgi:phage gp46-like protein